MLYRSLAFPPKKHPKNSGDPFVFTLGAGQVIKGKKEKKEKERELEQEVFDVKMKNPPFGSLVSLFPFFPSTFATKQAGTRDSTRCASARSASSRSPRTWATVRSFFYFYKREREFGGVARKRAKKKLTLFSFLPLTPKKPRRDGIAAQDPRRCHAHLRDGADGDQRQGLKTREMIENGREKRAVFKVFFPSSPSLERRKETKTTRCNSKRLLCCPRKKAKSISNEGREKERKAQEEETQNYPSFEDERSGVFKKKTPSPAPLFCAAASFSSSLFFFCCFPFLC